MCYAGIGLTLGPIDYSANVGKYVPMGSIMVLPGCTAYLFKDYNYKGERLELNNYLIKCLNSINAELIAD